MRIVIERGHSPYDPGAIGPTGLTEFEVVRAVAQRMGAMGYEVKGRDRKLSTLLWQLRWNKPDVVVSLHCNAPSKTVHRCDVYLWREESDSIILQQSTALATLIAEKAQGKFAEAGAIRWFPILRNNKYGEIEKFTPGIVRGTAKVAAVVVEMGFLSDKHTEAAMRTESWRDRAALAIHEGIEAWVKANAELGVSPLAGGAA
ncbi:MAG TPA: N-acetylmuramoyl-L-alanine amidase [Anaerolineae bacterium]|nr:N-acetylmuramoyl-L-alanine amidase [Anaerolineae bacterium]